MKMYKFFIVDCNNNIKMSSNGYFTHFKNLPKEFNFDYLAIQCLNYNKQIIKEIRKFLLDIEEKIKICNEKIYSLSKNYIEEKKFLEKDRKIILKKIKEFDQTGHI